MLESREGGLKIDEVIHSKHISLRPVGKNFYKQFSFENSSEYGMMNSWFLDFTFYKLHETQEKLKIEANSQFDIADWILNVYATFINLYNFRKSDYFVKIH